MKLLLDENLPKKLKSLLSGYEVYTVREMGWNGIKNGKLLQLMVENSFECFLTFDRNIAYQQNFKRYPFAVIVLVARNNRYSRLSKLMPEVEKILSSGLNDWPIEVVEHHE